MTTPRLIPPSRIERLVTVGSAVSSTLGLYDRARKAHNKWRENRWYVVTVADTEPIWLDLQERILGLIPSAEQRSLNVVFQRSQNDRPVALAYDGTRTHTVTIAGHPVNVSVVSVSDGRVKATQSIFETEDTPAQIGGSSRSDRKQRTLQFDCRTTEARDALVAWIAEAAEARRTRQNPPEFHIANRWGGWDNMPPTARREPGTVILRDNLMDDLLADVARFLAAREWYEERGVPWHRGLLLEGPPRTGKSSIARALATHFNLDLWYLPLGDISGDANLLQYVSLIGTGGVLLLEDVDVFSAAQDRDTASPVSGLLGGVTLSGVLNTLDGVATPPGLFKVCTTNNVGALDRAIVERFERREHIGYINDDQLRRIFRLMYGHLDVDLVSVEGAELSVSAVVECCKLHPDPNEAEAAAAAINELRGRAARTRTEGES